MKLWKRVLFYLLEDVILDFFVVEKAIRADHSTTGRSYLDLKMELAMGLIGGSHSERRQAFLQLVIQLMKFVCRILVCTCLSGLI